MKKGIVSGCISLFLVLSLSYSALTYVYPVWHRWFNANGTKSVIGYTYMENIRDTTYNAHQAKTYCGSSTKWGPKAYKGQKSQTASAWCSLWDSYGTILYTYFH